MKTSLIIGILIAGIVAGMVSSSPAITVYLKDGTRIEVDRVTRVGNSVCLLVDISQIDTTRTAIESVPGQEPKIQQGLTVTDVNFQPSEDGEEIFATGNVMNNSQQNVKNLRVTIILMDKSNRVLLTVRSSVQPDTLAPNQQGRYQTHIKKPKGFWKARVEVQSDTILQP